VTGPDAATPAGVAAGEPPDTRAALPIARAPTRRLPTVCAAPSAAHRPAVHDTAVRNGRRNGLARARPDGRRQPVVPDGEMGTFAGEQRLPPGRFPSRQQGRGDHLPAAPAPGGAYA
jgi:hypothetical protein